MSSEPRFFATRVSLAVLAVLLLTTRGLTLADAAIHLDVAVGLVERASPALSIDPGDLWVETESTAGAIFYLDGEHLRTSFPPGLALLASPLVGIGSLVAHVRGDGPVTERIQPAFGDDASSFEELFETMNRDPRAIGLALVGPIAASLAVFFVGLTLSHLGVGRRGQLAAVSALFASSFGVFAGTAWTQPLCALAVAFALYWSSRPKGAPTAIPLGFALAAMSLVRLDHAPIALLLIGLACLRATGLRARVQTAFELGVPLLAALLFLFFWDLPTPVSGTWSLTQLARGGSGLVFSPLSGLLFYAPFVFVAAAGLPHLRPRVLVLIVLFQLVLYGGWMDWDATFAYGPRFLVPSLPIFAVALGLAWERSPRLRPATVIAIVLGAVVSLPGMLLAHARFGEHHDWMHADFVRAWRVLLSERTVDCVARYEPTYPVLALLIAVIAMSLTTIGARARTASQDG